MNEPEWNDYLQQFDLDASYFQEITKNTNKYCVIVEPRIHDKLIPVIKNFMYLLQSKGWGLIIFHGTTNEDHLQELKDWPNIIYINLGVVNFTKDQYSDLLCSSQFWKTLLDHKCEHAFIFQTDTVLLNDIIDDFIEYDYIGAPWCEKMLGILEVGNGGLSLRNVNKMLQITREIPRVYSVEDIYFSYSALKIGAKIPTITVAKSFAVETIFCENTCGIHQPHIHRFPNRECFVKLLEKRWVIPK